MGVREELNKKPSVGIGVTIGIIVLALGCVAYEVHGIRNPTPPPPTLGYFTDDDGATFFTGPLTQIPPFDHNGKQAVAAVVFKCKRGDPFIGYLQRYTPAGKKALLTPGPPAFGGEAQIQVSAPHKGEKGWTAIFSNAAPAIMNVKSPDGSAEIPEVVQP